MILSCKNLNCILSVTARDLRHSSILLNPELLSSKLPIKSSVLRLWEVEEIVDIDRCAY